MVDINQYTYIFVFFFLVRDLSKSKYIIHVVLILSFKTIRDFNYFNFTIQYYCTCGQQKFQPNDGSSYEVARLMFPNSKCNYYNKITQTRQIDNSIQREIG